MRRFWKNHKGVTMMEVLVTVGLLAIVVVPCLSSFVMAQKGNVLADQIYNEYTNASNLAESLKTLPVPEGSTWKQEIEAAISSAGQNDLDKISVYGEFKNSDSYYEIRIYAGELETEPEADSGVAPILRGVITP